MNERRIEELLIDMPLASPSASLDDRVLGDAAADRHRWRLDGWRGAGVGLAAGLAIAVAVWGLLEVAGPAAHDGDPAARRAVVDAGGAMAPGLPESAATTVRATDTKLVDEGLVMSDDRLPVHQIRRVTTRQLMYYNQRTNERLEVTVPQEELILIAAETF